MNQIQLAHLTGSMHIHPGDAIAAFITTLAIPELCSWLANSKSK